MGKNVGRHRSRKIADPVAALKAKQKRDENSVRGPENIGG
jgi:hypothetical protein